MRYLTPLLTDARGKLGGTVYSRNPYGPYTRAKTAPLQPRTPSQQLGRTLFAAASTAWKSLTQPQRDAWAAYAQGLQKADSLGRRYNPSGYQTFVTHYRFAQQAGATAAPAPPTSPLSYFSLAFTMFATISTGTGTFTLGITPADPTLLTVGTYIPYATPGLSQTINFVPRQTYRNLSAAFNRDPFLDFWHAETDYLDVLAQPAVGQVIHMQLRKANKFSGLVSAATKASAVVTSVP